MPAKEYYQKNPEKYRKENREYLKTEKGKIANRRATKQWLRNNPEYYKEYMKKWREENKEKISEQHKKYRKTKEGRATVQRGHIKRRFQMKEIINTLTAEEWLDILKQHNFKCAYCGKDLAVAVSATPTRDHVIPISKGGNNIKENIVPSCRSCNSKKYNKILKGVE